MPCLSFAFSWSLSCLVSPQRSTSSSVSSVLNATRLYCTSSAVIPPSSEISYLWVTNLATLSLSSERSSQKRLLTGKPGSLDPEHTELKIFSLIVPSFLITNFNNHFQTNVDKTLSIYKRILLLLHNEIQ